MVEDEPGAARAQRQSDEEQQVWRVARMHDVDGALAADLDREAQRVEQRERVLAQIPARAAGGRAQRVAQDPDILDHRLLLGVLTGADRADDGDLETSVGQRPGLLPYPTVE